MASECSDIRIEIRVTSEYSETAKTDGDMVHLLLPRRFLVITATTATTATTTTTTTTTHSGRQLQHRQSLNR
jgi:hypothetical protein